MITQTNQQRELATTKYVSLSQLAQQARPYEQMPVQLHEALQRTVWWTLAGEIAAVLVSLFLPRDIFVSSGFFMLGTDQLVNALLGACYTVLPYVLFVNTVNLCVTLAILAISRWMTKPVHESLHWVAALQPVPTVLSGVAVTSLGILLALVTIVVTILWVVIGFIVVCAAFAGLAAMASG